jgi:hypothetical protein
MTFRMPKTIVNDVWQCDMLLFGNATCCFPTVGQSSYVLLPGAQSKPSMKIWVFVVSKSFKQSLLSTDCDGDDDIAT